MTLLWPSFAFLKFGTEKWINEKGPRKIRGPKFESKNKRNTQIAFRSGATVLN
jgi:hypothetical protein